MPLDPSATPNLNRRNLFTATAVGGAALLGACGTGADEDGGGDAWTYTDDRGETVELGGAPAVVVAFTGLAASLHDYGVEVAAVFGPTVTADGGPDPQAGRLPVNDLEIIGNVFGEFDLEAYAALGPDLLVSHHYEGFPLWYVPEERIGQIEELAPSIGVQVSDSTLGEVLDRHTRLAEALGADLDSAENAAAADRYDAAVEAVRAAATANPITILACNAYGENFSIANPPDFTVLATCAELGVDLVVPEAPADGGYWEPLSWENADKYDADLIFLDARSGNLQAPDLVDYPTWNAISGVAAGQVFAWNSEPVFSHVGAAEILEAIAQAITEAEPVTA
ncbi:ABC transporter substrate-binding protein [Glycomyces sp. A-F 0318]|uniref:ABC transporter substrate-binding protein n=1 Tax=Glycomyces amatae TaxID=2881355 RepID=UPI001E5C3B71|nr:ABC transporter substrate-binding protein [Glycomyces amatae]MCD0444738.1 ABC transporter substrate-binding protein [Glycomyces amatae]